MELENQTIRRPRRRFSVEEKARVVGLCKQSGLTRSEFCRREGVSFLIYERWLGREAQSKVARFVELEARALAGHGRYRFGFEGGAWLEVHMDPPQAKKTPPAPND